ncbi:MAG TPA: hypothetical protein VNZ04_09210 [Trinickia sp.]|nr:hypothetical protein [Trinickia sp.]
MHHLTVNCRETATALFKGSHSSFYGTNRISAAKESAVTIACDTISFNQEVDPVFQFDAGAGEIIFDTYSGQLPFDFMSNRYPHRLFNFVTTSGINATKIRIFGIGNAFQRSQMEEMKVVAIDGMPQHSWKNVIEHQYGKDLVFWLKNP